MGNLKSPRGDREVKGEPKAKAARDKLYTFDDVARLVCKGADPPPGLALHFRKWARPLEGYPDFPRPQPMSRREMVEALKEIGGAADVILAGLCGQPAGFLGAPESSAHSDRIALINLLLDLKRKCWHAIAAPPLASAQGGVKRGPGDAARPDGTSLATICAGATLLAWQEIHRTLPGSRNQHAWEAAEAFYQLASDPIEGGEPRLARPSWGNNLLTSWRRPFEAARAQSPILGASHDVYLHGLRAALAAGSASSNVDVAGVNPADGGGPNSA